MTKYRNNLPQLSDVPFLSDGGIETTLIFHEGLDLPLFASFPLVETEEGRSHLRKYYLPYLELARRNRVGFILDTPTWRANPDWAAKLGYDTAALDAVNREAVRQMFALRTEFETRESPFVVSGAIGPRGDGYKAGNMDEFEAEDYHAAQIASFAGEGADMVAAYTMNNHREAIGVARAARAQDMPCAIAFTVETDGRLANGFELGAAVEAVEAATDGSPVYYMINCAHPTHFTQALAKGERWTDRVRGVRANASAKSHAELDESTELDAGDPADLGRRYAALRRDFPSMLVLGGCCGTDHRHIAAICEACLPAAA